MAIAKNLTYNQLEIDKWWVTFWIHSSIRNYNTLFRPLTQVNIPLKFVQDQPDDEPGEINVEVDNLNADAKSSAKLMEVMSDPWDPSPNLTWTDLITNLSVNGQVNKQPLIDKEIQQHLRDNEQNVFYLRLSTYLILKQKKHMFYFPMDFVELKIDCLLDTGALTSAISDADLKKMKLSSNRSIIDTGRESNIQILLANGQLENHSGTVELSFGVADFELIEKFIVMKTLPHPLISVCFFFNGTMRYSTLDKRY